MDSYTSAAFPTFGWTAATAELAQLSNRRLEAAQAVASCCFSVPSFLFSSKKEQKQSFFGQQSFWKEGWKQRKLSLVQLSIFDF
jgi:hypothetical protein